MKLIGAWVAVMLLLMVGACGSKKKGLMKTETIYYQQQASETSTRHRAVSVEQYGDTLRGSIPLPFQFPSTPGVSFPYILPVSSQGLDLEITLDSAGVSYRAIAKPTAKVNIRESESKTQESSSIQAVVKEEQKTKEVKQGIPWWLILIGILLVLILVAWRLLKNHFNPL